MSGMTDNVPAEQPSSEFIVYTSEDGKAQVQLRSIDGTVWLTQRQMSDLFDKDVRTINEHIRNVYEDGEAQEGATIRKFRIVQLEGERSVSREVETYNLDVVLAVGFRVRSARAVQFRLWATTVLREYLIKGFAMDDRRLKNPAGVDYFDELLERIRDIRASEKRFYQKVKDVFATAVDYDPNSAIAREFFATVQNKVTFAVTGHTAAELIRKRADSQVDNMGLTSWDGKKVTKADTSVAKNYLTKDEVTELNRLSTMFMDSVEDRARRRKQVKMADWAQFTDKFLDFNDRDVLKNAGKVSRAAGEAHAHGEYLKFDAARKAAALEQSEREHFEEISRIEKQIEERDAD